MSFAKFLRTHFFTKHLWWLLLDISSSTFLTFISLLFVKTYYTAQKMKFFITDFFSKCDQIRRKFFMQCYILILESSVQYKDHTFYFTHYCKSKKLPKIFRKTFLTSRKCSRAKMNQDLNNRANVKYDQQCFFLEVFYFLEH